MKHTFEGSEVDAGLELQHFADAFQRIGGCAQILAVDIAGAFDRVSHLGHGTAKSPASGPQW